jgi:hypothetical protein
MRQHTRAGDICYEPFSGSGSQIVAGGGSAGVCLRWSLRRSTWLWLCSGIGM